MKITIVTHTGSDMPLWEAEKLGVQVIPDIVVFKDRSYRNMYELTAGAFYERLVKEPQLPTTSHPSTGDFCEYFRKAAKGADEVLFLSVTSKMSGSYMAAVSARDTLKKEGLMTPIYIYDTLQCSHGMGVLIREAVRLAEEGLTVSEIVPKLEALRKKVGVYFLLGSLKYARKGGRVGAIRALAADSLGIKPLMVFDDGVVRDIGVSRGFADGLQKVLAQYEESADFQLPVTVFHQASPEKAEQLLSMIRGKHPDTEVRIEEVGPVIGVYTGPGGAGLAFTKR